MTEEQMLDYFQKEGIPHEQRGGKLFVADKSGLPGQFAAYFNDAGFFVDAGKKGVEREVKETVAEEGLGDNPAPGDEPKNGKEDVEEAERKPKAAKKTTSKKK